MLEIGFLKYMCDKNGDHFLITFSLDTQMSHGCALPQCNNRFCILTVNEDDTSSLLLLLLFCMPRMYCFLPDEGTIKGLTERARGSIHKRAQPQGSVKQGVLSLGLP